MAAPALTCGLASPRQPVLFLLDAAAMSSAVATKSWELRATSHNLDTSKRLLSCYECLRAHRPDAQILSLMEADGYGQLLTGWRGTQERLVGEVLSSLQCVPFGSKVSAFLVELANQRAAKGLQVAIISNDVDIVVANRSDICVNGRWLHFGFMFVEDEFLLPGLSQIPSVDAASTVAIVASCTSKRRRVQEAPPAKSARLQERKPFAEAQSEGLHRSGVAEDAVQKAEHWPKGSVSDDSIQKTPADQDSAALDGSPASQAHCVVEAPGLHGRHQSKAQSTSSQARLPLSAGACFTQLSDAQVSGCTPKATGSNEFMYQDTQVDVNVDICMATQKPSSTVCTSAHVNKMILQPNIEKEIVMQTDRLESDAALLCGDMDADMDQKSPIPGSEQTVGVACLATPRTEQMEVGNHETSMQPTVEQVAPAVIAASAQLPSGCQESLTATIEVPPTVGPLRSCEESPVASTEVPANVVPLPNASQETVAVLPEVVPTVPVLPEPEPTEAEACRSAHEGMAETVEKEHEAARIDVQKLGLAHSIATRPPAPRYASTPYLEEDISVGKGLVVLVEDEMSPAESKAGKEGIAEEPGDKHHADTGNVDCTREVTPSSEQQFDSMVAAGSTANHIGTVLTADITSANAVQSQSHDHQSQLNDFGGQQRLATSSVPTRHVEGLTVAGSSSLPVACHFDINVLLGEWMRDGGRTHVVQSIRATGHSHQPGAIEFRPAGGIGGKPIVRSSGRWSLNGYALDETESTGDVLRWRHTLSGSVRTWWRPASKAPTQEGSSVPPAPSNLLLVASEPAAN